MRPCNSYSMQKYLKNNWYIVTEDTHRCRSYLQRNPRFPKKGYNTFLHIDNMYLWQAIAWVVYLWCIHRYWRTTIVGITYYVPVRKYRYTP